MTLLAVAMLQQPAKHAIDTVFVTAPAGNQVDVAWIPHSVGGILGVIAALLAITGAGSFAAMWRYLLRPVYERIALDKKELEQKVTKEREERERAIEIATERRDRKFDEIVKPETGLLALVKKDLTIAINGVGTNVSTLVESRAEREGRVRQLEDRMQRSEDDRAALHREFGELKTDVEKLDDTVRNMQVEVIHHIQRASDKTSDEIKKLGDRFTKVERQVAVIDDRTKQPRGEVT